ncbi:hypothetical protein [Streptomyces sp. NPDC055085]
MVFGYEPASESVAEATLWHYDPGTNEEICIAAKRFSISKREDADTIIV